MLKRRFGLILAGVTCTAIVGASFRAIPEQRSWDPNRFWIEQGIDPKVGRATQHFVQQFSADVRNHRAVKETDFEQILALMKKGGSLASVAYSNSVTLVGTRYQARIAEVAVKGAKSKNESEAFEALEVLRLFGDCHWRALALARKDDPSEIIQIDVREAQN